MRTLLALGLLLAACKSRREGGVEVEVAFSGFKPGCIEVTATDGVKSGSTTVRVAESRAYFVGIGPGEGWGRTWTVSAAGRETDCSGRIVAVTADTLEVPSGAVASLRLELTATDLDGDGFVAAPRGSDCNDLRAAVAPGREERCDNDADDDCNGKADCAEAVCAGAVCAPAGPCRPNAGRCMSGSCVQAFDAPGSACGGGRACRNDGTCVDAGGELDCADGLDDDMDDAGIDCQDSDCAGAGCNAGACVVNARCVNGACTGPMKDCGAPGTCRDAGVCDPLDGGCSFPLAPSGSACDDGQSCTAMDRCDPSGACTGTMSCPAPGQCRVSVCTTGSCSSVPSSGGGCDDGVPCTFADTCAGGGCTGTPYTCAPGACHSAAQCDGDGGCAFTPVANGTSCALGTCVDGGCVSVFAYAPSNVDLAQVPPSGDVLINCRVTFDSSDAGSTGWCGGPAPAVYTITQRGSGEPATVLSMQKLSLTRDGGQLRLVGAHPVILLVWDPATTTVDGLIDARSTKGDAGAGSDRASCGAQAGQPGATLGSGRGSGGGGAGHATGGTRGGHANGNVTPGGDGGAAMTPSLSGLVGGCQGGHGGVGLGDGGFPGSGGGAVQLSVAGELRIGATGRLTVSGSGGWAVPGSTRSGGGGGGSGGMLLLEAEVLNLGAGPWLTANGGGGAEAADDNEDGDPGDDGSWVSAAVAQGGSGAANNGGDGADGAAAGNGPGTPQDGKDCGGGGGGASGRIQLRARTSCARSANTSPPAMHDGGCL